MSGLRPSPRKVSGVHAGSRVVCTTSPVFVITPRAPQARATVTQGRVLRWTNGHCSRKQHQFPPPHVRPTGRCSRPCLLSASFRSALAQQWTGPKASFAELEVVYGRAWARPRALGSCECFSLEAADQSTRASIR
ncbi:hypothetical protein HIM_02929 [Hirsutella minnesotensis 3608]|nr:hypothetical protein HIM_02929 [Hirsutella minnesotensis 3608]